MTVSTSDRASRLPDSCRCVACSRPGRAASMIRPSADRPALVAGADWRKLAWSVRVSAPPGVRRLVTLLAMAAIASALGGVARAAAGGKPMPAAVRSAAAVEASQAGAGDRPAYLADPADPGVTTLASDLGISIREAQQRMGWQEPAIALACSTPGRAPATSPVHRWLQRQEHRRRQVVCHDRRPLRPSGPDLLRLPAPHPAVACPGAHAQLCLGRAHLRLCLLR